mgnify:CR=1 FL=1
MKVILDINPKDSSRVEICKALLNSMTPSETKQFLNYMYGIHAIYADTDCMSAPTVNWSKKITHDISLNINDIGTITEVVRLMLVAALSNNDASFKRRILEDAYNKLQDHASMFCFPPFD